MLPADSPSKALPAYPNPLHGPIILSVKLQDHLRRQRSGRDVPFSQHPCRGAALLRPKRPGFCPSPWSHRFSPARRDVSFVLRYTRSLPAAKCARSRQDASATSCRPPVNRIIRDRWQPTDGAANLFAENQFILRSRKLFLTTIALTLFTIACAQQPAPKDPP